MTDQESQIQKTVALLQAAPREKFIKAVAELDRKTGIAEVQEIKERIRERMVEVRPPRRLNITRVFCEPFEEMLRNRIDEQSTWLPRAAISPCWRIVEGKMPPKVLTEMKLKLDGIAEDDRPALTKFGEPLWRASGQVLEATALAARIGDARAVELLGGDPEMIEYAEVIAAACQVAPAIEELKGIFPHRPFKSMNLADREQLRAELTGLAGKHEYDLRCIIHLVAHWTANPAEIFELCADLDLGVATSIGKVLVAQREKVVVGLLSEQMKDLRVSLDTDGMDLNQCAEMARVTADSIGAALTMMKDNKSVDGDKNIGNLKKELGTVLKSRVIGAASQALASVWGTGKGDSEPQDKETIIAAEAAARAMRKCGQAASKLGVEAAITQKINASLETVRKEVAGKIASLQKNGQASLPEVQSTLANATRILEILEGPERAFEFFKEKRAAIRANTQDRTTAAAA